MKYGDIVQLGRHRLMCGDARNRGDIETLIDGECVDLVLTDPPYGISIQGEDGRIPNHARLHGIHYPSQTHPHMISDDNVQCARDNYAIIRDLCGRMILWGANYYSDVLPPSGGWLVWDKGIRLRNSFSHCELAWTNVCNNTRIYQQLWSGCFRAGSYTLNPRPRRHVCQKPVELHARILEDFSAEGDIILDCFGGSGTTLIACEVTGRTCLMMELSPDYCDIIINRYQTLTQGGIPFASCN